MLRAMERAQPIEMPEPAPSRQLYLGTSERTVAMQGGLQEGSMRPSGYRITSLPDLLFLLL